MSHSAPLSTPNGPACCVPDCGRAHKAKGFCQSHYNRFRKYGDPLKGSPIETRPKRSGCDVEGCQKKHFGRGWCQMHYERWRTHGSVHYVATRRPPQSQRKCSIPDCNDAASRKGWCSSHWHRWQRHGDPLLGGKRRQKEAPTLCTVAGCERFHAADGYCLGHYQRVRAHGDPLPNVPFRQYRSPGTPIVNAQGYVTIKGKLEHHIVMEEIIGRPLKKGIENVHHINGIRSDNRPENLELWTKPQPCGQRPADLAEWVVEHYLELVEAALSKRNQLRLVS